MPLPEERSWFSFAAEAINSERLARSWSGPSTRPLYVRTSSPGSFLFFRSRSCSCYAPAPGAFGKEARRLPRNGFTSSVSPQRGGPFPAESNRWLAAAPRSEFCPSSPRARTAAGPSTLLAVLRASDVTDSARK